MKPSLYIVPLALAVAAVMAFQFKGQHVAETDAQRLAFKMKSIIRCSPDWNALADWIDESDIPPSPVQERINGTLPLRAIARSSISTRA